MTCSCISLFQHLRYFDVGKMPDCFVVIDKVSYSQVPRDDTDSSLKIIVCAVGIAMSAICLRLFTLF